jgi:NlpC/P60 family putative phage cell wall peptidase
MRTAERAALVRAGAVSEVLTWLGTPYLHQASQKGQGTDCLGLVRGVYRHLFGKEPELPPAYSRRAGREETLVAAAARHLTPVTSPEPGDVLFFRLRRSLPISHCGILIAKDRFVHAHDGQCVTSASLEGFWGEKLAAAYAFPSEVP